ncbi:hypothetical protein FUAX_48500 (plasmid) [Fulvitalea axinellae]|uniref:Uncharacterized protein n=1 Tax=Fulvitalea axinellae TaxID=1182444 RepID=A0AAU9CQC7_9BACT|nr:hypothetical protein FUAX_48500 [Fulvitalea axinellae]
MFQKRNKTKPVQKSANTNNAAYRQDFRQEAVLQAKMAGVIRGEAPIQRKIYLGNALEPVATIDGLPKEICLKMLQYESKREEMTDEDRVVAVKLHQYFHFDIPLRIASDTKWEDLKKRFNDEGVRGNDLTTNFKRGDLIVGAGGPRATKSIKERLPQTADDYLTVEAFLKRLNVDELRTDPKKFKTRIINLATMFGRNEKDPNFLYSVSALNSMLMKFRSPSANDVRRNLISSRLARRHVHFDLDGTDDAVVIKKLLEGDDTYLPHDINDVLHLLHDQRLVRAVDDPESRVLYYRNGKLANAPWVDNPDLWELAQPENVAKHQDKLARRKAKYKTASEAFEVVEWGDLTEDGLMLTDYQVGRRAIILSRDHLSDFTDEQLATGGGVNRECTAVEEKGWQMDDHRLIAKQFASNPQHEERIFTRLERVADLITQKRESEAMSEAWSQKKEKKRSAASTREVERLRKQMEESQFGNPQPFGKDNDDEL